MSDIDRSPWKHDLMLDPDWRKLVEKSEARIQALSDEAFGQKFGGDITIEDVLGDLFDPSVRKLGPKDWIPAHSVRKRPYTQADVLVIMAQLRNYRVDSYEMLVRDAVGYMVEEAVMPNWDDIEYAFDLAKEWVEGREGVSYGLWEPIMDRAKWNNSEKIMKSLLLKMKLSDAVGASTMNTNGVRITFDASKSEAVKALEKAYYADPENLSEKDMEHGLGEEFRSVMDAVVSRFWRVLEDHVDHFDVWNRSDWKKWWRDSLENLNAVIDARAEFDAILVDVKGS